MGTKTTHEPVAAGTTTAAAATSPVPPPERRAVGVARHPGTTPGSARFTTAPRYPAMFHVAGGRLVWDGARLRLARGDGTVVEPAGRPVVTITGDGPTVVVTWRDDRLTAASAHATRTVLLDGSSARFARFARGLLTARPGSIVLDDRTVPSPRLPRLRPGRAGTSRRPGVFARALWRVVGRGVGRGVVPASAAATTDGGAGLVARLERLATLHRTGELTDAEFARAKEHLLS